MFWGIIKQFCLKLNYNKKIFYACLHLIDNYLIHELKKEISKREIALITLGFFLVALKFNENDIFEPKLDKFYKIGNDIIWDIDKNLPDTIKPVKHCLPSDGRFREDLLWLYRSLYKAKNEKEEEYFREIGMKWKVMMEEFNRWERKHRAGYNEKLKKKY